MNILIDINHPAHVHLYRNTYFQLREHGHNVWVVVKEIPAAIRLLDLYQIPYINIGKKDDDLLKKGLDQLVYDWRIWKFVCKHHIDIGFGTSINLAHVSKVSRMKSIILDDDDDEVEPLFAKYAHPFADTILSPDCIHRKAKQTIGYPGYHDLAYLYPKYFQPDVAILDELGLKPDESFFVLRFNAFKAHHDVGAHGLTLENKRRLINTLLPYGKVFITAERDIDEEFKQYQLCVSPEKIHSLMYYATMFLGDSQSMTSEAAVLGTPAIKCNTFAGRLAVPNEIEERYNMCFCFLPENTEQMFDKINTLLAMPNLKEEFQTRRQRMLSEKIDVTRFLTWFIENYPASASEARATNFNWEQFK